MIRYVNEYDKNDCIEMMKEFYSTTAVSYKVSEKNFENTFNLCMNDSPYTKIILCLGDDKYLGYANISLTHSNEAGGLVVLIEEVYVRPGNQGKGIGSKFMDFIRKEFDSSAKRYRLEVTESNKGAIRLYEKLGFKHIEYDQMFLDI